MTTNPIPYITNLKRESDGFANGVHVAALGAGLVFVVWSGLAAFGFVTAPPAVFATYIRYALWVWLVFFGLAALIDYTIFAVFRSFSEWLDAAFDAFAQAHTPSDAEGAFDKVPDVTPDQRDSTVAYLHDFIKITRQATDDVSPLNPNPAA